MPLNIYVLGEADDLLCAITPSTSVPYEEKLDQVWQLICLTTANKLGAALALWVMYRDHTIAYYSEPGRVVSEERIGCMLQAALEASPDASKMMTVVVFEQCPEAQITRQAASQAMPQLALDMRAGRMGPATNLFEGH
jgi:hypothetical protein